MTNSIREIPLSESFLIIGSNTTENHPVIGSMIKNEVINKGKKLVVVDPRKIELARYADIFLQIKAGTNIAILNGFAHVLIKEDLYDKEFVQNRCEGFEEMAKALEKYTPEFVANICGIDDPFKIVEAARLFAASKPMALYYCMGITQFKSGTNGVKSCANLQMLLGNIGILGGGVNPLRGQNNVQGACDMGALPNVYTGYQSVSIDDNREKFIKMWGSEFELSKNPGLTVVESLNGVLTGDVKAIYIMGENPVISDPDQSHVIEALKQLDFLVVQDIVMTETAALADVVLPACAFLEKEGTVTNTERRVQLMKKIVTPPGEVKEDWRIIMEIANIMGANWDYKSAEDIFEEIRQLTPSYGGITYKRLEKELIQWPCPRENHPGTQILHKDRFSRGLGLFSVVEFTPPAEDIDPQYPMVLTTGRILQHFHTGTMTRNSKILDEICHEAFIEIHPNDASNYNISNGEEISISTRRGSVRVKAKITDRVKPGIIFMPFHFAEAAANKLTHDAMDPYCSIPELKICACKIEKVNAIGGLSE
ncbi:MAG: Formate dehydrogenase H [Spirochaetes bacterium ADurb.Bin218]|jgi:formate dehydrogenase alpha subunit|nr:MAG: Formate dehydrogenase H [Spirochaetes bacterium ADurb.Bin218]